MTNSLVLGFFVFLIGACFGSFFKLVVDRYQTQESFVSIPSHCMKCKKNLLWWHNIPILSYAFLKGKCYFCKTSIDFNSLLAEFAVGVCAVFLFLSIVVKDFSLLYAVLFCSVFMCLILLSIFDIKHRLIPHMITYSAIVFVIVMNFFLKVPIITSFLNLGIAFLFMDFLYLTSSLFKKFDLEASSISVPLLLWTILFFFVHNLYLSILIAFAYMICVKFEVILKFSLQLWMALFALILFQLYKLIFIDLQIENCFMFLAGIGIVYLICEIFIYFFNWFFKKEETQEDVDTSSKVTIGGGDITVFALISVFLGYKLAFYVLFVASLLAIISHFIMRVVVYVADKINFKAKGSLQTAKLKAQSYIPFVPFLSVACFIIIMAVHGR